MSQLGFPCAITFYSISGKFDQILLKIALNTNNKYILKLIIKKLALATAKLEKLCQEKTI